jgi:hypothetical protein
MAHNGGRTQLNFWFFPIGLDYPFINVMKTSESVTHITGGAVYNPTQLDANGYPTTISSGGAEWTVFMPPASMRPGQYKIITDGGGTMFSSGGFESPSGMNQVGAAFTPPATGTMTFRITATDASPNHLRNVRIVHEDDVTACLAGDIWAPQFISRLTELNPGVIRFLDWQNNNVAAIAKWQYRRGVGYAYYGGYENRGTTYSAATRAAGNVFTCAAPADWPGLIHGATVTLKPDVSMDSDIGTLNVGGTGAKPILNTVAADVIHVDASISFRFLSTRYQTVTYDIEHDAWLVTGYAGNQLLHNGLPYELMVDLCNELNAHPWFLMPFLAADDPDEDFITGLAEYCRDNLNAGLKPHFEGPNETWNLATGFLASYYGPPKYDKLWSTSATCTISSATPAVVSCTGHGFTAGQHIRFLTTNTLPAGMVPHRQYTVSATDLAANTFKFSYAGSLVNTTDTGTGTHSVQFYSELFKQDDWYGRVMSRMGQTISATYSADRSRYEVIAGVWTGQPDPTSSDEKFASTKYVTEDGGSAAFNWITGLACTNYWNSAWLFTAREVTEAYTWSQSGSADRSALVNAYLEGAGVALTSSSHRNFFAQPNTKTLMQQWKDYGLAISGNIRLFGYEGGYSPDYFTGPTMGESMLMPAFSAASKAANCVLTLPTHDNSIQYSGVIGQPIIIADTGGTATAAAGMVELGAIGTVTAASKAASCVVTMTGHFMQIGMHVRLASVGGMTELTAAREVSAVSLGTTTTFTVASGHGIKVGALVYLTGFGATAELSEGVYEVTAVAATTVTVALNSTGFIAGATGSMTPWWRVTNVSGNDVTIDVDSTGFTTYTSGGTATPVYRVSSVPSASTIALNVNSTAFTTYTSGTSIYYIGAVGYMNAFRRAVKFAPDMVRLELAQMQDCREVGMVWPSIYMFSGVPAAWSVQDNIYATPTKRWDAALLYNQRKRRIRLRGTA